MIRYLHRTAVRIPTRSWCARWYSAGTASTPTLRVAVVGSGPAGFYTAYKILDRFPDGSVTMDMYEKLPVPFGLARFGVAPDHPEVKNCEEKFEEVAQSRYFRFIGNTAIGAAVSCSFSSFTSNYIPLALLQKHYDAVILAYGADSDKDMSGSITNLALRGVHSAREFVGWYNGHPEFQDLDFDLARGSGQAVVVGHGNVALDVARILLTNVNDLRKTDITEAAIARLSESKVTNVHIVGRRGPAQASFTNKEVRELMTLPGVGFIPPPDDLMAPLLSDAKALPRATKRLVQLLQKGSPTPYTSAAKTFSFDFLRSPLSVEEDHRLNGYIAGATFDVMALQGEACVKDTRARATGIAERYDCDNYFLSIGYQTHPLAGLEDFYDSAVNHLIQGGGHVAASDNREVIGLYASGWIKRGPTGVIAETMYDAFETAASVIEDFEAGKIGSSSRRQRDGWEGVRAELGNALSWRIVGWGDWLKIDAAERERGRVLGKVREKFVTQKDMLEVIS
ncbi:uncharacterized protein V1518DRAFT_418616 [Limtongia smithiae]|uniref:uncharacterized protein n=1 Tax=Limtongia smithiae TaxID=1125753 RepID=UPI0034CEB991